MKKITRMILMIIVLTLVSLLYVWQQTEIFRLAYAGQKRVSRYQELLDRNALLRYNIAKSASLIRIGDKISKSTEFQLPKQYRLVKVAAKRHQPLVVAQNLPRREEILSYIFSVKRQAEARTIAP